MHVRELYEHFSLTVFQCPQQVVMFFEGTLLLLRSGKRTETDGMGAPCVFMYRLSQHLVSTKREEGIVEALITAKDTAAVVAADREVVIRLDAPQFGKLIRGYGQGHAAEGLALQQDAEIVEIHDMLLLETANHGAHITAPLNQSGLPPARERVAHDMPPGREARDETVLHPALLRIQHAQNDVFLQYNGNLLRLDRRDCRCGVPFRLACLTPWNAALRFNGSQEIEIGALIRLGNALQEQLLITASGLRHLHRSFRLPTLYFIFGHQPFDPAFGYRQTDPV